MIRFDSTLTSRVFTGTPSSCWISHDRADLSERVTGRLNMMRSRRSPSIGRDIVTDTIVGCALATTRRAVAAAIQRAKNITSE